MTATGTIRPRYLVCYRCGADVTAAQHGRALADLLALATLDCAADAAGAGDVGRLARHADATDTIHCRGDASTFDADGNVVLCPACHGLGMDAAGPVPATLPPAPVLTLPADPAVPAAPASCPDCGMVRYHTPGCLRAGQDAPPVPAPPAFMWACVSCGVPLPLTAIGPGLCGDCRPW